MSSAVARARMRRYPLALAATAVLAVCAGCSSGNGSGSSAATTVSTQSATATAGSAALCSSLQTLNDDVNRMKSLDANNTTLGQITTLSDRIKTDLNNAAQNASGLASVKLTAVKTAYSALASALSGLPSSITASQAYQAIQPQITALLAAVDAAASGIDCPSPSSSAS